MILEFQFRRKMESPTEMGATRWQITKTRMYEGLCVLANRLRMPGTIRETTLHDDLTGQEVEIRMSKLFTRISINGRDYYFHRFTGKYDGTGSGCR